MKELINLLGTPLGRLRIISLIEALSFLALLGVAMPLKYIYGMPGAVSAVGMVHGLLFLVFVVVLIEAWLEVKWSILPPTLIFVASVIPFAPIFAERWLRKEQLRLGAAEVQAT